MKSLILFAAFAIAGSCFSPAVAQDAAIRIVPGFEKVYGDLKKKENEQLKEIARADAETDAAESLRLDGERLIADSNAQIESHIIAYRSFSATMGAAKTARDAKTEAKGLEDLAKLWGKAEDEKARGEKMIRASEANAAKSIERRRKAEARIADLRAAMARTYEEGAPVAAGASASANGLSSESVVGAGGLSPTAVSKGDLPALSEPPVQKAPTAGASPDDSLDSQLLGGTKPDDQPNGAAPLKGD
jgi:hypothetical protein